jgi:ribosome biogenesis protein NSA2
MKKTIKSHEEKETKERQEVPEGALPAYLLDREKQSRAKVLSNTIKQKRKEKAVSFSHKICTFSNKYIGL